MTGPTPLRELPNAAEKQPIFNVPLVVTILVAVLFAVHATRKLMGENIEVWSVFAFAFIPERFLGVDAIAQLPGSRWWSFLTSGLLHADWTHLIFNSIWLVIFGTPVARLFGWWRFLLLVSVATIAGSAAVLGLHWGERLYLLGASGAVSGLTAAAVPIMFGRGRMKRGGTVHQTLSFQEYLTNSRAAMFTLLWLGLQLLPQWLTSASGALTGTAFLEERPIAWEAHLGGFVAGFIVFYVLRALYVSKSP
jgi:membrane associated rhomboid family serine protease